MFQSASIIEILTPIIGVLIYWIRESNIDKRSANKKEDLINWLKEMDHSLKEKIETLENLDLPVLLRKKEKTFFASVILLVGGLATGTYFYGNMGLSYKIFILTYFIYLLFLVLSPTIELYMFKSKRIYNIILTIDFIFRLSIVFQFLIINTIIFSNEVSNLTTKLWLSALPTSMVLILWGVYRTFYSKYFSIVKKKLEYILSRDEKFNFDNVSLEIVTKNEKFEGKLINLGLYDRYITILESKNGEKYKTPIEWDKVLYVKLKTKNKDSYDW